MPIFRPASTQQLNSGLFIARIVTGLIFVAHGSQKLFGYGLEAVTAGFGQVGILMPGLAAPAVVFVEILGGLALGLGLLTRVASAGLVVVMLGATLLVHLGNGFFLPTGYEFTLLLAAIAAMFTLTGAGTWSVDARIAARRASATKSPSRA